MQLDLAGIAASLGLSLRERIDPAFAIADRHASSRRPIAVVGSL